MVGTGRATGQGVLVAISRQTLGGEEFLDPVAQLLFPGILAPPSPINRPVHRGAPGIELKFNTPGPPWTNPRRAVKIGVFRSEAGNGTGCVLEKFAAPPRPPRPATTL